MRMTILGALALVALVPFATAADEKKPDPDRDFLPQAITCNITAWKIADLADKRSNREDVKEWARKVAADHKDMNAKLLKLAEKQKLAVVEGLEKDKKAVVDELSKLQGDEFDRKFLDVMITEHERAIRMCEGQAKATDADIRDCCAKGLETLKTHLKQAKELQAKKKNS